MTRRARGTAGGEDGAAAAEFALIVPILILLFFGIVYFGLYIFRQQVIESATREGARVAAVGLGQSEVEDAVERAAGSAFRASEVSFPRVDLCTDRDGFARVDVEASGPRLNFTVPFFDNGSGGTVTPTFRATATFECEKAVGP